jgi:gas vesicle protein GvpG
VLLVDDILCFPVTSILWMFREIHNAAREELASESESITNQLRNLYMQLELAQISEQDFDTQEKLLLDRLDRLETTSAPDEDEDLVESEPVAKGP